MSSLIARGKSVPDVAGRNCEAATPRKCWFVELREVIIVGDLIIHAAEVEVFASIRTSEAAVLVVEGDVLEVSAVAVLGFIQAPAGEGLVLDLFGGQQAIFEGLRQDAPVVGLQDRQFWDQAADFSSVTEIFTLPVRPSLEYSSAARPSSWVGNRASQQRMWL